MNKETNAPYRDFTPEEIHEVFSYHQPSEKQAAIYNEINRAFQSCATVVAGLMPSGPGRTAAIRKLADARMACNAAVALDGKF